MNGEQLFLNRDRAAYCHRFKFQYTIVLSVCSLSSQQLTPHALLCVVIVHVVICEAARYVRCKIALYGNGCRGLLQCHFYRKWASDKTTNTISHGFGDLVTCFSVDRTPQMRDTWRTLKLCRSFQRTIITQVSEKVFRCSVDATAASSAAVWERCSVEVCWFKWQHPSCHVWLYGRLAFTCCLL